MTPNAPTWGEIEDFLRTDGWRTVPAQDRGGDRQKHVFYEKVLADRRLLRTHISHSREKSPSAGRFSSILNKQLEVSRDEFWAALRTGTPVDRPGTPEQSPAPRHEGWVVNVLGRDLHMTPDEIEALAPEEAQARVHEYWSEPRP